MALPLLETSCLAPLVSATSSFLFHSAFRGGASLGPARRITSSSSLTQHELYGAMLEGAYLGSTGADSFGSDKNAVPLEGFGTVNGLEALGGSGMSASANVLFALLKAVLHRNPTLFNVELRDELSKEQLGGGLRESE
jgi:hypothetical protein